jgi:hypothetical protein
VPGVRKSGIPTETEMPAPTNAQCYVECTMLCEQQYYQNRKFKSPAITMIFCALPHLMYVASFSRVGSLLKSATFSSGVISCFGIVAPIVLLRCVLLSDLCQFVEGRKGISRKKRN